MGPGQRFLLAELLLRKGRAAVFPWHLSSAFDRSNDAHIHGTEPAVADDADVPWIGAALLKALDESATPVEPHADPVSTGNKARQKAFGVRSNRALNDGMSTVGVRRWSDRVTVIPFAASGAPGEQVELPVDVQAEPLGQAALDAAASCA